MREENLRSRRRIPGGGGGDSSMSVSPGPENKPVRTRLSKRLLQEEEINGLPDMSEHPDRGFEKQG
jgi:hypothetical protein